MLNKKKIKEREEFNLKERIRNQDYDKYLSFRLSSRLNKINVSKERFTQSNPLPDKTKESIESKSIIEENYMTYLSLRRDGKPEVTREKAKIPGWYLAKKAEIISLKDKYKQDLNDKIKGFNDNIKKLKRKKEKRRIHSLIEKRNKQLNNIEKLRKKKLKNEREKKRIEKAKKLKKKEKREWIQKERIKRKRKYELEKENRIIKIEQEKKEFLLEERQKELDMFRRLKREELQEEKIRDRLLRIKRLKEFNRGTNAIIKRFEKRREEHIKEIPTSEENYEKYLRLRSDGKPEVIREKSKIPGWYLAKKAEIISLKEKYKQGLNDKIKGFNDHIRKLKTNENKNRKKLLIKERQKELSIIARIEQEELLENEKLIKIAKNKKINNKLFNQYKKKIYSNAKPLIPIAIGLILLFSLVMFLPLKPTGFITVSNEFNYTDNLDLTLNNSQEYTWIMDNYGKLNSLQLDGSISKEGSAKAYLEHNGRSYLIFDSLRLDNEGISDITGLAVSETVNENRPITISLEGGGRKDIGDVFEFKVDSGFNWDVDYNKVCTKWNIDNISLCYGSEECCALLGLENSGNWNDSLYLSYGRYNSKLNNNIKTQVIYANYSLDIESPYSDIIYSDVKETTAEFYEALIEFKDICVETCLLPSLNATSYNLKFVVENASLKINNIKYSVEKETIMNENAPLLIKSIENVTVYKNENIKINLNRYFVDEDGDNLTYAAYEIDNIRVVIENSLARIIPTYNFTGKRYIYFTASDGYYGTNSNLIEIKVVEKPLLVDDVNISEQLIKPQIVINRPVRWIKKVNVSAGVINLSINISSDALNVSVRNIKEDKIISENKLKVNDNGVIKNATAYGAEKRIEKIEKIENKLEDEKAKIIREDPTAMQEISSINKELISLQSERNKLTGYVVASKDKGLLTRFFEWLFKVDITGYAIADVSSNEDSDVTSVIIEDIIEEIEIEYYTEAPISEEEPISSGKRIVVSSDTHYEDILAYTYLNNVEKSKIRLYHIVNSSKVLVNNISYYDEDNNNLIDYIEWVVPHLSNQTYEIIIITNAVHLNSDREFIANIYDYVKAQDDNWSEIINNEEYVRITFEVPLDNTRDITIYARSNENSKIEVYEKDGSDVIAVFDSIHEESLHKVYLTNLNGTQNTFDLKINGSVEFDYIVDPSSRIGLSLIYPTTSINATYNKLFNVTVNVSCSVSNCEEINITLDSEDAALSNDFDTGELGGDDWTTYKSDETNGNLSVRDTDAYSGSYSIIGDVEAGGGYNLNELITNYDFSGNSYIYLTFYWREADEGEDGDAGSDHSVHQNADAVYFSCNGTYWYHLADAPASFVAWEKKEINITADPDFCTNITENFKIKFTQYDNAKWPVDGIAWDEITIAYRQGGGGIISTNSSKLPFWTNMTTNPYNISLDVGESQIVTFWVNATGVINESFDFFVYANMTSNVSISNITNQFNITIVPPDTTFPIWSNNKTNLTTNTSIGKKAYFNITLNETNPSTYIFSWYNSTAWTNNTATSYTNKQEISIIKQINTNSGTINWTWYFNDTVGNSNQTDIWSKIIDIIPPTWENNKTNLTSSTTLGSVVQFNITLNDTYSNKYIFSWYNGTTWTNNSAASYTNGQKIEVDKTININSGSINWTWYFNDTAGNSNQTNIWGKTIDTLPPTWENNKTNITTSTSVGESVYFNITINDSNPGNYIFSWYNGSSWLNDSSASYTDGQEIQINKTINSTPINWTWYLNDSYGNNNQTDIWGVDIDPTIGISIVYPTIDINATQYEFFNVTVNVSCVGVIDCGEVNVTLDPASETVYNFTTCSATGRLGPSQANCDSAYSETTLEGLVGVGGGIQNWTVPTTGTYTIEVAGARGSITSTSGASGGSGSRMIGTFSLTAGTVLQILVGQIGPTHTYGGAGGGGTFVASGSSYSVATPMIVAGGGGGGSCSGTADGIAAVTIINGTDGQGSTGNKGTNGYGGGAGTSSYKGSGGGGFYGNGTRGYYANGGGMAFISGGTGGLQGSSGSPGGFGGGGANGWWGGGAGGGYSGGGGGATDCYGGGGGGSLNNGTNQNNTAGVNTGDGYVSITYLTGADKPGTVSTLTNATPFYTNMSSNPYNISLSAGESQLVTFWVNATGDGNDTFEFFVYANKTSRLSVSNTTIKWNVTINDSTIPTISFNTPTTSNGLYAQNWISANVTTNDTHLSTIVINLYNSSGSSVSSSSGTSSPTFNNFTSLSDGIYYLNATATDTASNANSTETRTIDLDITSPQFNFTSPTPTNDTRQPENYTEINISITEAHLDVLKYNWNETNYTMYNDSLVLMLNFDNVSSLDENNTYFVDMSRKGHNGTGVSFDNDEFVPGKYGKAIKFVPNDYISIPHHTDFNFGIADFTISLWFNATEIPEGGSHELIGKRADGIGDYELQIDVDGAISGYIGADAPVQVKSISDVSNYLNQWVHVTLTRRSGNMYLYFNGVEENSNSAGGNVDTTANLEIGKDPAGTEYFTGSIDEVKIWNIGLSKTEVYQQYASNLKKLDTNSWELYVNQSKNATDDLLEGNYTYNVFASDTLSYQNTSETRLIIIDWTIPTFTNISNQTVEHYAGVMYDINATDENEISCFAVNDTTNFKINCTGYLENNTLLSNGLYWLNITINDTAGNNNSNLMWVNITDTTPPIFTDIANQTSEYGTTFTYDINATDSNNISCFTVNDTTNFQVNCSGYMENNTLLSINLHWLNITINDTSGNENNSLMVVNVSDTTPPTINITYPANNTYTTNTGLHVNYTVSDLNSVSCWYSNDTMSTNTTLANCINITDVTWVESQHNVTVWVNDTYKNVNTSNIMFTIDLTTPIFTNITNQTIYEEDEFGYDINVSDTSPISCFTVNDTTNFKINCSGYLENNTELNQSAVKLYWLNITVNDSAGNENSNLMWVNVTDKGRLDLTVITPTTDLNVSINKTFLVTVNISCRDNDCGEINVTLDPEDCNGGCIELDVLGETVTMDTNTRTSPTTFDGARANCLAIGADMANFEESYYWAINKGINSLDIAYYSAGNIDFCDTTSAANGDSCCAEVGEGYGWHDYYGCGCHNCYNGGSTYSTGSSGGYICVWRTAGKGGTVSTLTNATPFWTSVTNPYNITLNQDQASLITWTVNATGTINQSYVFFVYANKTADMPIGNSTGTWNVTIRPPSNIPVFTNLANQTIEVGRALAYDIDATDPDGINCFTVNNTENFKINCSGYLENNTNLSINVYWLNISVGDNVGNNNSNLIRINVTDADLTTPGVSITYPTDSSIFNYTTTIVPLNVTTNEDTSCAYSTNSGQNNYSMATNDSGFNFNATINVSSGNSYTVKVYCNDSSGNLNKTESVSFSINVSPSIGLIAIYPTSALNVPHKKFFNVTVNVSCLKRDCGEINVSLSSNITTDSSATPFYTNITNPYNITLNENESSIITWWVNSTGSLDTIQEFYVYANKTNIGISISNETTRWDATIKDLTSPQLSFNSDTTADGSYNLKRTITVNVTASDLYLNTTTIYIYNSTALINSTTSTYIQLTNVTYGTYYINATANDTSGNINNTATRTITLNKPTISISRIWPTTNVNVSQGKWFNVTINVTCLEQTCGDINVTLDPITNIECGDITNCDFSQTGDCSGADGTCTNIPGWTYYEVTDGTYEQAEVSTSANPFGDKGNWLQFQSTYTGSRVTSWRAYIFSDTFTANADYLTYNFDGEDFDEWGFGLMIYEDGNETGNYQVLESRCPYTGSWSAEDNVWGGCNDNSNSNPAAQIDETVAIDASLKNKNIRIKAWTGDGWSGDHGKANLDDICLSYVDGTCISTVKAIISTTSGTIPFWTNKSSNPYAINLNTTNSSIITFYVNATGAINTTYDFFVYATIANDTSIRNDTSHWNVSIADLTAPIVNFSSPTTQAGNFSQNHIDAAVTASDDNLANITIYLYNSSGLVNSTTSDTLSTYSVNFSNLNDETYYLNGTGTDTSGNSGSTGTRTIKLDTIKPIINISAPIDGLNTTSTTINFTFSVEDNSTSNCTLYKDIEGSLSYVIATYNSSVLPDINTTLNASGFEDRVNSWYITCTDPAGNTNTTNTRTFSVDSIAPTIVVTSPTANGSFGYFIYLKTEITDALHDIDSAWYFMYNNSNASQKLVNGSLNSTDNWDATWNASSYGEIEWNVTFSVFANDTVGNIINKNTSFYLDNSNPVIQLITPPANLEYYNSNFSLNIVVQDSLLNYTYYNLSSQGIIIQSNSSTYDTPIKEHIWQDIVNVTDNADGIYNLTVFGQDSTGNSINVSTYFIMDKTNPSLTLNYPAENEYLNITSINFNWTIIDNISTTLDCNITIGDTAKQLYCVNATGCNYTFTGFSEISYNFSINCKDNASNVATTTSNFTVDTTIPLISFTDITTSTGNKSQNYISINVSVTDENIDNLTVRFYDSSRSLINTSSNSNSSLFLNLTNLEEGTYYFNATVNDSVGYSNYTETRTVSLDDVYPIASISKNDSVLEFGFNSISLNWSTSDNNLKTTLFNITLPGGYLLYNSTDSSGNVNLTESSLIGIGTYVVLLRAEDNAGNINLTSTTFSVDDTGAPAVYLVNPDSGNYPRTWIFVNATSPDTGLSTLTIYLYNQTNLVNQSIGASSPYSVNFTLLPDGLYYYNATACDETRCNSTETKSITLDTTGPSITILTPANNSNWNVSSLEFDISTNEIATWCGISINGNTNQTMTLNSSSTGASYTDNSIANNKYTFIVSCNDTFNNYGNSNTYNFLIDTIKPNTTFVSPTLADSSTTGNNWSLINASAIDNNNISTFIDLDDSLVSWWRMDDLSGTTVIDYMGRNDGTKQGDAVQIENGKLGKGFEFDGDGDYIEVTITQNKNSTSFWYKNSTSSSWTHVVNTSGTLYINGIIATPVQYPIYTNGNTIQIGKIDSSSYFNGSIDDIIIFNRTLNISEIKGLYVNQTSKYLDINFTSLSDGTHTFKAYTQDIAGNINTTEERTITVDTVAPIVNISYPINRSNISWNSIDLNASAIDEISSTLTYYWVINGTTNTTTANTNSTLNAAEGHYNLTVIVSDGVNNGSNSIFFTLDITNLTINSVTVTPTKSTAGTTFNITTNVTDDVQINNVIAYIQKPDENNIATINLSLNNGLYNGSWNSSDRSDGTYVIDIVADDEYSNRKERENWAAIALAPYSINISVNSSVNITSDSYVIINATEEANTWLNITTSVNTTSSITIAGYSDNVKLVDPTSITELSKYVDIIVDDDTNNNISSAEIRVYYTDEEVVTANLIESTLRLYKFDPSSSIWNLISLGGVETTLNYVWGNVSSFSSFGIFGTAVSTATADITTTTSTSSNARGLCTPKWECSEWSKCTKGGIQTRTCTRIGTCFMGEPEESRNCEFTPKVKKDTKKEIRKDILTPKKTGNIIKFISTMLALIIIITIFITVNHKTEKKEIKEKINIKEKYKRLR